MNNLRLVVNSLMTRIRRKTALELSAELIRKDLLIGRWTEKLPGCRTLARELGVSGPTVAKALKLLAHEGLLADQGNNRPYKVLNLTEKVVTQNNQKQFFLITHVNLDHLPATARQVINQTCAKLEAEDWAVEYRCFDFLNAKSPHHSWDHLVPEQSKSPIIAVFGRQAIVDWALARKQPIALLGGASNTPEVPVLGVDTVAMATTAAEHLIALGHRDIIMPVCGHASDFTTSVRNSLHQAFSKAGIPFNPNYHCPSRTLRAPDVLNRLLRQCFAVKPPTALILLDWKELITAASLLLELGLRIPQDVSIIMLNQQTEADWFQPELSHFKIPIHQMAKKLAQWVKHSPALRGKTLLTANFLPGQSIARLA